MVCVVFGKMEWGGRHVRCGVVVEGMVNWGGIDL